MIIYSRPNSPQQSELACRRRISWWLLWFCNARKRKRIIEIEMRLGITIEKSPCLYSWPRYHRQMIIARTNNQRLTNAPGGRFSTGWIINFRLQYFHSAIGGWLRNCKRNGWSLNVHTGMPDLDSNVLLLTILFRLWISHVEISYNKPLLSYLQILIADCTIFSSMLNTWRHVVGNYLVGEIRILKSSSLSFSFLLCQKPPLPLKRSCWPELNTENGQTEPFWHMPKRKMQMQ